MEQEHGRGRDRLGGGGDREPRRRGDRQPTGIVGEPEAVGEEDPILTSNHDRPAEAVLPGQSLGVGPELYHRTAVRVASRRGPGCRLGRMDRSGASGNRDQKQHRCSFKRAWVAHRCMNA